MAVSDLIGHGVRYNGRTYEIVGSTLGDDRGVGGDTVFDMFPQQPYTFLEISRGTVIGDGIIAEYTAYGVIKLRSGMNVSNDQETKSSDDTLHIKPSESFLLNVPANAEHYRVTLQEREFDDLSG